MNPVQLDPFGFNWIDPVLNGCDPVLTGSIRLLKWIRVFRFPVFLGADSGYSGYSRFKLGIQLTGSIRLTGFLGFRFKLDPGFPVTNWIQP